MSGVGKTCYTCKQEKPREDFSKDKSTKDGLISSCRPCDNAKQRERRKNNPERHQSYQRKHYEKRKESGQVQAYYQANKERFVEHNKTSSPKYRARHRERLAEKQREYYRRNKDDFYRHAHIRRMRKYGSGTHEKFTRDEIGDRDGWVCGICHLSIDRSLKFPERMSPSLDHIKPLSHGGPHTRDNCRIAHLTCNISRGNRMRRTEVQSSDSQDLCEDN